MTKVAFIATLFSGLSFLFYGVTCLTSLHMKNEFIRFKIPQWRTTTGILQLIGAIGLLVGYYTSLLLAGISATGLFLLMVLGFTVRIKIKDTFLASSPAFLYAILNLYLSVYFFKMWLLNAQTMS